MNVYVHRWVKLTTTALWVVANSNNNNNNNNNNGVMVTVKLWPFTFAALVTRCHKSKVLERIATRVKPTPAIFFMWKWEVRLDRGRISVTT